MRAHALVHTLTQGTPRSSNRPPPRFESPPLPLSLSPSPARALALSTGLEVALVESLPQIMAPFDPEMAAPLAAELRRHGIAVHTGAAIEAFEAPAGGGPGSEVRARPAPPPSFSALRRESPAGPVVL